MRRVFAVGIAATLMVVGAVVTGIGGATAAPNLPDVTVRVTILELEDLNDDLDSLSDADFYTLIKFDDHAGNTAEVSNEDADETEEVEGEEHIYPNWETSHTFNPSAGRIGVSIQVKDEDGFLNFKDDTADVIAGGVVNVEVDLRPCAIEIAGTSHPCSQPLTFSSGDNVVFKIDVLLPTSTPGLRIQCLQDPVHPQPGDTVTITAVALDGGANPLAVADSVKILVNGVDVASVTGAATTSFTFTAAGQELWYECTAEDAGSAEQATTTPRSFRIGTQNELAVPIVFTGPSSRRIDIVVLYDATSYPSDTDAAFLKDLHDVLLDQPANPDATQRRGLFANEYTLTKQNAFNIWVAKSSADASWDAASKTCSLREPENWDEYAFADAGWILHDDVFRDCAMGSIRMFSAEPIEPGTSVHELGHTPFGLADEYCCDGGYWQAPERPNVYASLSACRADAPAAGNPASNCRLLGPGSTWYTSDAPGEVMNGDRTTFRPLDRRRWDEMTKRCVDTGGC